MNSKSILNLKTEQFWFLSFEFEIQNDFYFTDFSNSSFEKKFRLNVDIYFNDICKKLDNYIQIFFSIWKIRKSEIDLASYCKSAFSGSRKAIQTHHLNLVSSISLFSISFVISMFHLFTGLYYFDLQNLKIPQIPIDCCLVSTVLLKTVYVSKKSNYNQNMGMQFQFKIQIWWEFCATKLVHPEYIDFIVSKRRAYLAYWILKL